MKSRLFLIPAIFATTAALADAQTAVPPKPADAHVQAAALLSRPHTPETVKLERSSSVSEMALDAHASAAALLSGHRIALQATTSLAGGEPSFGRMSADAHALAAALLSGTRTATGMSRSRPVRVSGASETGIAPGR